MDLLACWYLVAPSTNSVYSRLILLWKCNMVLLGYYHPQCITFIFDTFLSLLNWYFFGNARLYLAFKEVVKGIWFCIGRYKLHKLSLFIFYYFPLFNFNVLLLTSGIWIWWHRPDQCQMDAWAVRNWKEGEFSV